MQRRKFLSGATSLVAIACSAHEKPIGQTSERLFPQQLPTRTSAFPQSVASGDPKPTSVVFWTRCPDHKTLFLQVAIDDEFADLLELSDDETPESSDRATLQLTTKSSHDHCVKVRVDDLKPNTVYYYRFIVETDEGPACSRTGRTKTAPDKNADVAVRFVVVSCQDYQARYYHALRRAAQLEPDFVVHLGDYIYETTDDPAFQMAATDRAISFRDVDGATPAGRPSTDETMPTSLAARSLDNYRQLYQVYRSDRDLQRLHETAPFIVVWDDHEFANDSTRDQSPSLGESDPTRRGNADEAWFEYMPVDFAERPTLDEGEFPNNLLIYRDLRFGKHLHLVMTDLRRFRPPPLIAEDTFPGKVLVTEPVLRDLYPELPEFARPYVQLDDDEYAGVREALRERATTWELSPDVFSGFHDLATLNTWIERYNAESGDTLDQVPESDAFARGIAAIHCGKSELNSSFGARYFVVEEAYEAVSLAAYRTSNGESENVLGPNQRKWFLETLHTSDATWKVWGNEYTFLHKIANLEGIPLLPDPNLQKKLLISVDDWDGAPHERSALLSELSDVERLVIVTGDIHSFFVGTTGIPDNVKQPLEFVCGAVSSATYDNLLAAAVALPGIGDAAPLADAILSASNPHVSYQNLESNGFALVTADETSLEVSFYQLPSSKVLLAELDGDLDDHFSVQTHVVARNGELM